MNESMNKSPFTEEGKVILRGESLLRVIQQIPDTRGLQPSSSNSTLSPVWPLLAAAFTDHQPLTAASCKPTGKPRQIMAYDFPLPKAKRVESIATTEKQTEKKKSLIPQRRT